MPITIDGSTNRLPRDAFPIGSVIQTQVLNSNTTTTAAMGTTLTEVSSSYRVSITPLYTNSLILVEYFIPGGVNSGWSSNYVMRTAGYRIVGGTFTNPTSTGPTVGSRTPISGFMHRTSNGYDLNDGMFSHFFIYDTPNTTSTIQYGFRMSTEGGTMTFGYNGGNDGSSFGFSSNIIIIAKEIKQ
jgi:hypothetical protein